MRLSKRCRSVDNADTLIVENGMSAITESDVEAAALSWLADTGWRTAHGPDIASGTPGRRARRLR